MHFDGCENVGALLGESQKLEILKCIQGSFCNFVSNCLSNNRPGLLTSLRGIQLRGLESKVNISFNNRW
jgi:hypothetical protein